MSVYLVWIIHRQKFYLVLESNGVVSWTRGRFGKEEPIFRDMDNHRQNPTKLTYREARRLQRAYKEHPALVMEDA